MPATYNSACMAALDAVVRAHRRGAYDVPIEVALRSAAQAMLATRI